MLDRFRRIIGIKPKEQGATPPPEPPPPTPPAPQAPATPPPNQPAQEGMLQVRTPPPATPPSQPAKPISAPAPTPPPQKSSAPTQPSLPKPVHSVSDHRVGRSGTAPLVAPSEPYRSPDAQLSARKQAEDYLKRLQAKINQLADDFAEGTINRDQFQKLYEHYQRERRGVENLLNADTSDTEFKSAINEGQSMVIRKQHIARAIGYSIYENASGMPITTLGHFELDPALVIPMLSSFRAATQEIFGAGLRSTAIEGGRWLCFVPGELTTLLALFSTEPAQKQLDYLEDLHRLFEKANRRHLMQSPVTPASLLFPHEFFLKG